VLKTTIAMSTFAAQAPLCAHRPITLSPDMHLCTVLRRFCRQFLAAVRLFVRAQELAPQHRAGILDSVLIVERGGCPYAVKALHASQVHL
jgi:hypothetical protein